MKLFFAARILALATLPLFAQVHGNRFASLPAASAAADQALDLAALEQKYAAHDAVFLERITDYENVIKTSQNTSVEWNILLTEYQKLVVLNPEAQDYTTLSIEVPAEQELEKVSLSITNPDGEHHEFDLQGMKEIRDSDGSAVYKFAFPGVQKGSVITHAYVVRDLYGFRNVTLDYYIPLQTEAPCLKASFRIVYPSNWAMAAKDLAPGKPLPVTVTTDKKTDLTALSFAAEDIPAYEPEPFAPFYRESALSAEVHLLKLAISSPGWRGLYYKAPKDWEALSKDFKEYVMDHDSIFSIRIDKQVRDLASDLSDPVEKLDAIITWIQENMTVVGHRENRAAGLNKASFSTLLEHRQGSVYQITGLALSMLERARIDCRYLLLHSAKDGYFDEKYVAYTQLATPAIMAVIEGKTYVVFPYRRRMPVNHVLEEFQGQKAMAIDGKGKWEFVQVPLGSASRNETVETCVVTIQEDGKLLVVDDRTLTGSAALKLRNDLEDLSSASTLKALKKRIPFAEGKVELKKHTIEDQGDYKKPLKIHLEYEVTDLVNLAGAEAIFNTSSLFAPISRIQVRDSSAHRTNDIRVYFDESIRKVIALKYPATWELATKVEDFDVENRFGAIQGHYQKGEGSLEVDQRLTLRKSADTKDHYPELEELTGRKTRHVIPALVFNVKP